MKLTYVLLALSFLLFSCKTPIEPDFSFTPETPRAGQLVTFTNLTETGEYWNWTFGDGGVWTGKKPTYIYR
ncbi:MAG: PKD domain-containing protein, partial [Bacteroidales bacterium]|nr:PKD domain-containing protein [Bacteroidales bacterium]